MFHRILVPTDGSDITEKAVSAAISLAKLADAELYTLTVTEPFLFSALTDEWQPLAPHAFMEAQERSADERLQAVRAACQRAGMQCATASVESPRPWQAILDHAKRTACDLIVMATHDRHGVTALINGSETQRVMQHARIPVLVVH